MKIETIGWITRAALALICVITICYLAILEKKIDPVLSGLVGSLLTAFAMSKPAAPETPDDPPPFTPTTKK